MTVRRFLARGAAVLSVVLLSTAGLAFAVGASAGAKSGSVEKSFEDDGDHEWVVPAGVCSVWIDARGASGGDAITPVTVDDPIPSVGEGGEGGEAKAKIAVTPGETLWIFVGGEGGDAVFTQLGEGGFNGGGDGGQSSTAVEDPDHAGAGGGGASDVRQGGDGLKDRVVVAGGGGGGAANDPEDQSLGSGGDGGGEEGDDGTPGRADPGPPQPDQAGEGGSQDEGGDGGTNVLVPGLAGDDGELGEGGDGGGSLGENTDGGGGGGGGYYGGGGGAGADNTDDPPGYEDAAGGGGGSGFGPDGTDFETGENDGDGEVTISYDPVADACVTEAIVVQPKFTG